MVVRKQKRIPNYVIKRFKMTKDGNIWRFWLAETKEFYSAEIIKERTYWENGECVNIEKILHET